MPRMETPNRLGVSFPLVAIGMDSGIISIYDLSTGAWVRNVETGYDTVSISTEVF